MSLFADAATATEANFKTTYGVDIAYEQDSTSVDISGAIPNDQRYEAYNDFGAPVIFESRDYHIQVADFVGLPSSLPKSGDKITESIGGVDSIYEVFPIGNLSFYGYQDERKTVFVIHTKAVDA